MFAVIRTGGKQYKVKEGDVLDIELVNGLEEGKGTSFKDVLLVADGDKVSVGKPLVEGAEVQADVLGEIRGKKITAFMFKRRQGLRKTKGHRQRHHRVKVTKISA